MKRLKEKNFKIILFEKSENPGTFKYKF